MQSRVIGIRVERTGCFGKIISEQKRVGDRTEPYGTPLLIESGEEHWSLTTAKLNQPERKLEINVQGGG